MDSMSNDTVITAGLLKRLQEPTREHCYAKIHRCVVTQANLDYNGSITVDVALLRAAGILPHTKVEVVNVSRKDAARIMTYVIEGPENSGVVCLNGAAAHHFRRGDLAIIMAYERVPVSQIPGREHRAVMVHAVEGKVDSGSNRIADVQVHVTPALNELGKPENNRYAESHAEKARITPIKGRSVRKR
jgi:aspartate 1-decarboxylase